MTKKRQLTQAVSEVVGIILLLGITIGLFGFLNYVVFSFSFQPSAPSVNLVGSIDKINNKFYIIIEHNGGEPLDGNTQITITNTSTTNQFNATDYLYDINDDSKWNFGETVKYPYMDDVTSVVVVDISTNTMILAFEP